MSSISHRTAGLLAVHLQFLLIFLPLKFIFILEEESSHVEHVLHVLGHMAATPLISHLAAVDTLATHEHGLNMVFPLLPVILNRNTESSQEELDAVLLGSTVGDCVGLLLLLDINEYSPV
jgi:hypothetical protein